MTRLTRGDTPAARLHRALIRVAVRAALLRTALSTDEANDADAAPKVALAELCRALDELEALAPGIHARLASDLERVVRNLRSA